MPAVTDAQILTMMNQSTDLLGMTRSVDSVLLGGNSIIGLVIMAMVLVVMTLSLHSRGVKFSSASGASLFVTGVLGMLLKAMNLVGDKWWWLGLTLIAFSVFVLFAFKED